jgi:hypothetical protein
MAFETVYEVGCLTGSILANLLIMYNKNAAKYLYFLNEEYCSASPCGDQGKE